MERSITKNSLILLGFRIISLLLALCSGIIIARVLGPEGKGTLAIAFLVPTLICTFFLFDSSNGIRYFVAKHPDRARTIINNSLVYAGFLGTALLGLFYLIIISFQNTINQWIAADILGTSILLVPFIIGTVLLSAVLSGMQRFFTVSVINLVNVGTYTLFILVMSSIYLTVKTVVLCKLAGFLVITLIFIALLLNEKLLSRPAALDVKLLKDIIKYGLKSYPGTIAQFLNYRLDLLLVAYFLSFEEVGLYILAVNWSELIFYLPDSMAAVLFPTIASSKSTKDSNELTAIMTKAVMIIMLIGSIFILLVAGKLIPFLYTDQFLGSIYPLFILLPGVLMLSMWKIIISDLAGRGFPQYKSITSTAGMILNVILNIILIPLYGINGAALATSLSYTLTTILSIYWHINITGTTLFQLLFIRRKDVTFILSRVSIKKQSSLTPKT
jgi:O-antigen/teichoic acid export membrane protein